MGVARGVGAYDEEPWGGIVEQSQAAFRPHWSADDQAIIFRGLPQDGLQSLEAWADGSVYRVGLDGSGLEKIASDAYWLDVSPSGDRISFTTVTYEEDDYRLESARQDGSDRLRLTERYHIATLSPDGTRLAFHDYWSDPASMSIMDADGSNVDRFAVLDTIGDRYSEREVEYRFETARQVWSPNGKYLAFAIRERAGSRPDHSYTDVLYAMRIDGSQLTEVFRTPSTDNDSQNIAEPAWSPDGRRLAFVHTSATRAVLRIVSSEGSALRTLAPGLDRDGLYMSGDVLVWSPDGSEILVELKNRNNRNLNLIYVADVESGRFQKLASGLAASWSPDGSHRCPWCRLAVPDAEIPFTETATLSLVMTRIAASPPLISIPMAGRWLGCAGSGVARYSQGRGRVQLASWRKLIPAPSGPGRSGSHANSATSPRLNFQ